MKYILQRTHKHTTGGGGLLICDPAKRNDDQSPVDKCRHSILVSEHSDNLQVCQEKLNNALGHLHKLTNPSGQAGWV